MKLFEFLFQESGTQNKDQSSVGARCCQQSTAQCFLRAAQLTHGRELNQTPVGLATHGYSLIPRAAIRLVELDHSRANVSQVWSLISVAAAFIPASSQRSGHLCLCVLAMIDEQPREDEGGRETWPGEFVLGRPQIRFRPEEPSG